MPEGSNLGQEERPQPQVSRAQVRAGARLQHKHASD